MLKKFKRFISNCSDFVNVYSKRIDEISKEVNSLSNEYRDVESNIKDDLLKIDEKIVNLDYKITSLLSSLDCVNLEYLNLDNCVSKNKVLIVGFYGAPNLGDELMLLTLLNKLSSFDNILDITVMMSENYNFDITGYPKCKIIHYPKNIIDINTLANYYDTVIFGGGALLDDSDYSLNSNMLSLGTTLINLAYRMITCKKKVILYGLSSSYELNNKEYIRKLNYVASNASYFSLRDTNSLKVLKKYGINIDKIKIVHDLVYSLDYYKYNKTFMKDSYIKVGLIYVCNENNYDKLCELTKAVVKYFKDNKRNYKIVMIPFYEYLNNDSNYYKKIIDCLSDKNIEVLEYTNNINEIFNTISGLDVCISMRYHGTLISNSLGVPTLNLLYDIHRHYKNKIDYLYKNYGYKNYQVNYSSANSESFINTFDELCKQQRSKLLSKQINIEANKQIDGVINEFVLKEGKVD